MRYGLLVGSNKSIPEVTAEARRAADAGIDIVAVSQIFGYDALTLLAVMGQTVPDVELLTAVVPTYPRHPLMLAAQALTVQAALDEPRLTLGIGLSHQIVIEGVLGLSFDRPARHMRDYLKVLMPLLHGQGVAYEGETLKTATGPLDIEASPPPVLVAALAPAMLKLAGTLADGTATWMTGPKTIAEHITPSITAAAESAGRPRPRISVGLPICVTEDPDAARERANRAFALYHQLPVYRAVLDREGAEGPGDVAIVGDAETVVAQMQALEDIGATEVLAAPYGSAEERDRTFAVVTELAVKQRQ
ncbi:MAG TPA: TIGR03564 family F420-dependent LLM class oxidoreductase [Acidimicrobiales bacterium]